MKPTQRVRLISEVSQRLKDHEWFLIDLCLSEFGVRTEESWGNDKRAYVVQLLRGASDETLLGLSEHVGLHLDGLSSPNAEPSFWTRGCLKLFISHTHEQARFAGQLQRQLQQYAISAFVAHKDIEPTKEWVVEIELALSTCDALTALLTTDFPLSKWTDQEIGYAVGRGRLVVPVAMGVMPYGFVQRYQAVRDGVDDAATLAGELFERLRRNKLCAERVEAAVVHRFATSASFDESRYNLDLLRRCEHLGRDSCLRLVQALEDNPQVHDAEYKGTLIPQLVTALMRDIGEDVSVVAGAPDDDIPF